MYPLTRSTSRSRFFPVPAGGGAGGFDVLDSGGTSYAVTLDVLNSSGTIYTVSQAVLASDGTSYNPI